MIREIELKYQFANKQDFLKALSLFSGEQTVENQTNFFYDTPDLKLKAQHVFLRLRQSNEQFILTCKAAPENTPKPSASLSIHDEWEMNLTPEEAEKSPLELLRKDWPSESDGLRQTRLSLLKRVQKIIQNEKIGFVGSFKNTRTHVPYQLDKYLLDLEFDQTDFGSRIDYELEIELPEDLPPQQVETRLQQLFQKLNIQTSLSSGKAERFFKLFNNQATFRSKNPALT